jgi:hypothetical protein
MDSIALFVIAFACLLGGACIGMTMRRILPEHHLSRDSTDVIKLATGLMATLVALVLSLLVSSANTFHGMIENQYNGALANVVQLDQYLQAYGPETRDIRQQIRRTVVRYFRQHWPRDDFGAIGALFLIVELNTPFSGVLQLSSAPAHATLAALGR